MTAAPINGEHRPPAVTHPWGRRLSDAVRDAVRQADWSASRRLVVQGDGRTRDLAREYALMVRGLGFTLEVLLGQLAQLQPLADAVHARVAGTADPLDERITILQRLLVALQAGPGSGTPAVDAPVGIWREACTGALRAAQARFAADQGRRSGDVSAAIENRDAGSALAALEAKDRAYLALHDPMVRFMADAFACVLHLQGPRGLLDFHLATAEGQRDGFEKWERLSAAEFAAASALLLQQHMGQVQVAEQADRFTIHQSPCGSGGRLRLGGAYDAQREGAAVPPLPFVSGPNPLTFGEAAAPVYCTHCAVWNGTATLRWFGRAQWVFDAPARADGSCTLHIYKRREDAPTEYARRVAHTAVERTP